MKLKEILINDLKQLKYTNNDIGVKDFIIAYITKPCYRYVIYMRLCKFTKKKKSLFGLFVIFRILFKRLSVKLGIQIPYTLEIGSGFSIHHYSCIVIHGKAVIGDNFNIRQGVTVGDVNSRVPIIGDNVYVGAGAKIIGGIKIGNK